MKKILLALFANIILLISYSQIKITKGFTENQVNPINIGIKYPKFSWSIYSEKRNFKQSAYQIQVYNNVQLVWDSEKIKNDQSLFIKYKGQPLKSNTKYSWKVKVWDNEGKSSDWSKIQTFQTTLFNISDWKAKWISPGFEESKQRPSPIFRKEFKSDKKIISATAFITSHGMYEAKINGLKIGDAYLTPGWTSYSKRLQYQSYDVSSLLKSGGNAIGVILGNGWYRGYIGFKNENNTYGKDIALLFQMNIKYDDGTEDIICSDESWKSNTGEIQSSEIYNGEIIDARLNEKGWNLTGFNDSKWYGVKINDFDYNNLIYTQNPLIKKQETFNSKKIITTPKGEKVIDFGQNLSGWVKMKVKGNKGDTIILSHAEVLDKFGNFYTENLRAAKAQNIYILKGEGEEVFEPHFTWQGFRYLKIEGYPGELNAEKFEAVVLHSDMELTGKLITSNNMINQLQHNILWGQKGNFIDVPTDCPQRDERLGWTGDAQVFSSTAAFNMNVHNFFTKWLKDLEADQVEGKVPHVIPNILAENKTNSAGWSDAATIIPWNLYLAYGDKNVLIEQYNSMIHYLESIEKIAKNDLWNSGTHYGDWLFYKPNEDNDGRSAVTDKGLIATCFYAHSTQLIINAAKVLNKQKDIIKYTLLLNKIKKSFIKEYVTPNGRLMSNTQTAYVLALNFDLLPEEIRQNSAKFLVDNINSYGIHLTTGFLGTPHLCNVLSRFGYSEIAYKLLLQTTYPSWLYPVSMGATTIWERWDGQKTDSTFQNKGMNSFNHYAYGAIGDWMYKHIGGIDTYEDGVGYKHIKIEPDISKELSFANASLETYYGKISCEWKKESNKTIVDIEIPANTTAAIFLKSKNIDSILESGIPIKTIKDLKITNNKNNIIKIELGSGYYHFIISN